MNTNERVIVISGDNGCTADAIHRMLADKGVAGQYEILTRDEAAGRGLMHDDLGQITPIAGRVLGAPITYPSSPRSHKPKPHPERDAWNAAVDERKAAKRAAKSSKSLPAGADKEST